MPLTRMRPRTAPPPRSRRQAAALATAAVALVATLAAATGALLAAAPASAAADDPVSLAVVVPITVPTDTQGTGLLKADALATDTGPNGLLTRQLADVVGTNAVLAVDPMIIVSIRVLGTAMPASARSWLAQLEALPNEKIPLAYADADPAALARAGGGLALLGQLDFQFAIAASDFGPAQTASPAPTGSASPTPTPTPTAGSPTPLPTNADLLAEDWTVQGIAWPAEGTVTGAELAPLASAGYTSVLLDSENVSSADSARVKLDGIEGLVSDSGLSDLARTAAASVGDAAVQSALQRLDAAIDGMQAVSPGRTVIATLDRGWWQSSTRLRDVLDNVATEASARSVGLSSVLAGPASDAKLVDGTLPDDGADLIPASIGSASTEAAFATVAGDQAAAVTSPRRLELLSAMSVDWIEGSGWANRLRAYLAESSALLDSVKVVHGSGVLVTASNANIPVTVSNSLQVPVTVVVTVIPGNPQLRITDRTVKLTIEPDASSRALIPAQALGTVKQGIAATIVLHSAADGSVQVGPRDTIDVSLRPSWEGIGTSIVVVLVVLIFGGGITRQVLRRRRARRAAAAGGPAPGADAAAGSDPGSAG